MKIDQPALTDATDYLAAMKHDAEARARLDNAHHSAQTARHALLVAKEKLSKLVGRNIPERAILVDGHVVVVRFNNDAPATISAIKVEAQ